MTETRIPGAITGALPAQPVRPARADRQTRDRRGPDPEQERQPPLPGGGRAPSDPKGAVTILGPEDGEAHQIDEYG